MPRQPTPADFKALRRLHDAACGREELSRWIDAALREGKQRRGPKECAEPFLIHVEMLCRTLMQQGASRTTALRQLVRDAGIRGHGTENSTIDRLRRKRAGLGNLHRTIGGVSA
jgi:hypothetical protein